MPGILDLMGYINQQGEQGRQRGLASLVGKAYGAPPEQRQGILSAVAQRGGTDMAMQAQQGFSKMDETSASDLAREAGMFVSLAQSGDPQTIDAAYQQLARKAQASGHPVPMQYDPKFLPGIQQLATAAKGSAGNIQSTYVDAHGNRVAITRDGRTQILGQNAPNNQIIDTGNNGFFGVNKGNLNAAPVMMGGQPQGPQMGDPQQVQQQFASLAGGFPGTQISSMQRTPEHNREVGGVPNSQHIAGTAGDFVVPPQEKAAFIVRAQAQGFEAIDEGDHVHLELPRGGGGQLRSAPKPQAPSDIERRLALAQQMGATPEQVQSMVLGSAAPKQSTPAQQAKMQLTARKERMMLSANDAQVDQTVKLINSIIARKGDLGGVTGIGRVGAKIPGTDWADVAAKLDTLKGRSAFGALQQMRANSPTGGALGQVSERELYLLQNAETQLQDSQSPESLVKALQDYKTALLESKRRMRDGMSEFYTEQGVGQQPASHGGGVDDLLSKYGIK